MADLSRRSFAPELMDTETVGFEEFHECLRHLEVVNRWTFAYRPTLRWLDRLIGRRGRPQYPLSILDVGFGHGDMLRRIALWAERHGITVQLRGIDLSPWSARAAAAATPAHMPIHYETGDIFDEANEQPPVDIVVSSLFTHHLGDDDLVRFLRWMTVRARIGWFINDLHRHALPYHFIGSVLRLMPVNRMVRHDAPVSVARSFTRADWLRLIRQAGLQPDQVSVDWFFPFRYGVGFPR
jgi:SAM-dependent methyltransferase